MNGQNDRLSVFTLGQIWGDSKSAAAPLNNGRWDCRKNTCIYMQRRRSKRGWESHSRPCWYDITGSYTATTLPRTNFSGIGNQTAPMPGTEGRRRHNTRLECDVLCCLAANPGRAFTKAQIFEAVWNMDSDSCHSSVVNVIYNLRKKIEPDNKNPIYIKIVLGVGYKFDG